MKPLIILTLLLNLTLSYGQTSNIGGHWRRADLAKKSKDTSVQFGDLLLNPDSTFTFVGYDGEPKSKIRGWHSGGTIKGTWTYTGNILSFKIENVRVPINYQILRLTKSELIYVSPMKKSIKLRFKRI